MILLIDNYDSFSYNLVQLVGTVSKEDIQVIRSDEKTVAEIAAMNPSHIILSPGPGRPSEAGVCEDVVKALSGKMPILGVCLGHQGICEALGGEVTYAKELMHGKQSLARLDTASPLFLGLKEEEPVARYHSLAAKREKLPKELKIIAETADGEVMAVAHETMPVYGLQFHPESVLTPGGRQMMENFLSL